MLVFFVDLIQHNRHRSMMENTSGSMRRSRAAVLLLGLSLLCPQAFGSRTPRLLASECTPKNYAVTAEDKGGLSSVAEKIGAGVTWQAICCANEELWDDKCGIIIPEQQLVIPCPGATESCKGTEAPEQSGDCGSHTVESGDSLYKIALQLAKDEKHKGLKDKDLCCFNNLEDCDSIFPDQELKVPCAPYNELRAACPSAIAPAPGGPDKCNQCESCDCDENCNCLPGTPAWKIAVGVSAGVVGALLLVALAVLLYRRRKRGPYKQYNDDSPKGGSVAGGGGKYLWEPSSQRSFANSKLIAGRCMYGAGSDVVAKLLPSREAYQREAAFYKKLSTGLSEHFPVIMDMFDTPPPLAPTAAAAGGGSGDRKTSLSTRLQWCIVMEKGQYTLHNWLRRAGPRPSALEMKLVAGSLVEALDALHGRNMVHGDLKPPNVMFFSYEHSHRWKIIDAGSWAQEGERVVPSYSLRYSAPEVVAAAKKKLPLEASPAADMWSLGAVLFELLSGGRALFAGRSDEEVADMLTGRALLPWEEGADSMDDVISAQVVEQQACRMIKALLQRDPQRRWSIKKVAQNAYFRSASDTQMVTQERGQVLDRLDDLRSQVGVLHAMSADALRMSTATALLTGLEIREVVTSATDGAGDGDGDAALPPGPGQLGPTAGGKGDDGDGAGPRGCDKACDGGQDDNNGWNRDDDLESACSSWHDACSNDVRSVAYMSRQSSCTSVAVVVAAAEEQVVPGSARDGAADWKGFSNEALCDAYAAGEVPTRPAPCTLASTLGITPNGGGGDGAPPEMHILRCGQRYVLHLRLAAGGPGGRYPLPISDVQMLVVAPEADPLDKVVVTLKRMEMEATTGGGDGSLAWEGCGVWDAGAHRDTDMWTPGQQVTLSVTALCTLRADGSALLLQQQLAVRLAQPGAKLYLEGNVIPDLQARVRDAPEWAKMVAWGAQRLFALKFDV